MILVEFLYFSSGLSTPKFHSAEHLQFKILYSCSIKNALPIRMEKKIEKEWRTNCNKENFFLKLLFSAPVSNPKLPFALTRHKTVNVWKFLLSVLYFPNTCQKFKKKWSISLQISSSLENSVYRIPSLTCWNFPTLFYFFLWLFKEDYQLSQLTLSGLT